MPDRFRTRAAHRSADAIQAYCHAFELAWSVQARPGSDERVAVADRRTSLEDCREARRIADATRPVDVVSARAHDARCAIWISHDPEACDCRDDQGYSPRDHQPAPPPAEPDGLFALPCDTDTEEAAS